MATLEEKINGLIKLALEDVNSVEEISIGSISKLAAEMVKEEAGRNVNGYELIMDTDSIRHVYKRHPEQIRDLFLIPLILPFQGMFLRHKPSENKVSTARLAESKRSFSRHVFAPRPCSSKLGMARLAESKRSFSRQCL